MTSNMSAGERRWVSARRGGMTVLGKVAVPKPLNLPSQRLENHGLDPNVEIVPKGTLSWGSRTSSSTSNPWGSSTHSPNADGGASSPSHLRSRPSSGGSGTRPSTAGSDRTQEPTTSAWGTSSRPSSASGSLSSSKVPSTLARPRSAETRPGSSQLSRFAEPVSEHPAAWGSTTTAERLGVLSSKNEGFSLTSGDFPTLGSDRDASGKTTESQDHGSCSRPSSASGNVAQPLEKTASHPDVKGGSFDAWKRDGQSAEDPPQHGIEKWQGDPHHYHGPNVPPQHFDAWRGPPMNTPAALWYRGPPGGPPYGAPVPPGGFPIEPFPYFPPQMPPPAIANSQPVPPGPGSRGHHPRGGDMYRPQIADAYIRPNMPFRPGFYSGPVAFEGYYGPPMGYCNSNEREIPLMGMPPGPPVYNRYSGPKTPDPGNFHARIGSHGANTKAMPEAMESGHPDDAKGPYKVLLKHDAREEGETWEHAAATNGPYHDRNFQRSLQKHERGGEHGGEKELYSRRATGSGNCYPRSYVDRGGDSSDTTNVNSLESINTMKVADGSWTKKSGYVESSGGVPPSSLALEKVSAPAVTAKDSSLMQKIEGLNAKVRASDGRYEAPYASSEEDMNKSELNPKVTNSVNEAKGGLTSSGRAHTSGTTGNKGGHSIAAMSRRPYYGAQTRNDHLGKAKFDSHDDGWRKKPIAADSSAVPSGTSLEHASNVHACELGPKVEAVEQASTDISISVEKESSSELHDSADTQAQRTKMKELARQRALQLQKEEEERIKQQRAKALAKLEELNRRMQAGDALCQKTEKDSPADVIKQDLQVSSPPETVVSTVKPQAHNATLTAHGDVIDASGHILNKDSKHINPPVVLEFGTSIMVQSEIAIPQPQVFPSKQDANRVSASHGKETCQSSDGGVVKHKRTNFKQRPNVTPKNMNEKSVPVSVTEVSKGPNDTTNNNVPFAEAHEVGLNAESNMVNNAKVAVESSVQPRKKGNRINKNKQKPDAVLPRPASPSPVQNDSNPVKVRTQQERLNSSQLVLDLNSNQAASGDNVVQPSDQSPRLPIEEGHGRVINHWKPQHPRRTQRNQHSNIHTDKFQGGDTVVWAPVRSQSKTEDAAEASQKTGSNSIGLLKSDNVVQSNSKSKRAEMERYVPKPVAKELAQHGSSQQPLLSGNSPGPDGTIGRTESKPENSGCSVPTGSATESFPIESRDGDVKHNNNNKQGKAHVWRQRGSTELALDTSKNDSKLDQTQSFKPDGDSMRYESKCSGEFDVSDGWNMPGDFEGQRTTIPAVPDEGTRGKGKRYPSKGHRSTGNSGYEYKNNSGGPQQNHTVSGVTEVNQMDRRAAAKENRGMGNRTPPPHWQPKSHMLAGNNQHAGVSNRAQNITMEGDRGNKRDYHDDKVSIPLPSGKESCDIGAGQADSFSSEDKIVSEVPNIRNLDARRERKPASFRGRPYSPNQGPVVKAESAAAESAEAVQEGSNSGLRRNVNQSNRSARSQDSHGDSFSVKDNRQHNTSSGRERRRNNMHYEYQPVGQYNNSKPSNFEEYPVGQYNNSKPSNFEEPADDSHNVDQKRYRERGQVQSKRGGGNFHGREGGSGRLNANYD